MAAAKTEAKHAPLPWSYHPICDAGTRTIASKQGPPVAYMPDPGAYGVGYISEHAANAELIVRAVNSHAELLAACKAALDCVQELASSHPDEFAEYPERLALAEQLEAAIAKAEA